MLDRNIQTLVELRRQVDQRRSAADRLADMVTRFTGSLTFVTIHLVLYGAWIVVNLPFAPGWLRFDPSYVVLAMEASVEAIFLSTFVLISQNRMAANSDKRAELDLQISLLAEHEITQAVKLLDAIAVHLGVDPRRDAGADPVAVEDSKHEVDPRAVFESIEAQRAPSQS